MISKPKRQGRHGTTRLGLAVALLAVAALSMLPGPVARAAVGDITTVAGGGLGDGGQATSAVLHAPFGVAVDAEGNLFIADTRNHRIRKVSATTGIITTVAGTGAAGFAGDGGTAISANLQAPQDVAVDGAGNLFIADTDNHRIRKVATATGIITTVAGSGGGERGGGGFSGDGGPATSASLFSPSGVAVDVAGNLIITDTVNSRIRKVAAATGVISTVAGGGSAGFSGDGGAATSASFLFPRDVAVDTAGNLFIADTLNSRVRKVAAATGVITTVAGTGTAGFFGDGGPATSAGLSPAGVAVDAAGNLFISGNFRIRKVAAGTGIITTVAGSGTGGFSGDGGPATSAGLSPSGVAVDVARNLFIVEAGNSRIRRLDAATGIITTVAGIGIGDGGAATSARLSFPSGVAVDGAGNLFIADTRNDLVRNVAAGTGIITTVAGTGTNGFSGDGGLATSARLNVPSGVAVDRAGNLFIADTNNARIRKVAPATGVITTVAGTDGLGSSGDGGPATSAVLHAPFGVAVDAAGNLFIADTGSLRIRKVAALTGIITTVAGSGTTMVGPGSGIGEGMPATEASLSKPLAVAVDAAGNLFIADTGHDHILKVAAATGVITTVAGDGFSGDGGRATRASLSGLSGVTVDATGNLFITDSNRSGVCKVAAATGIITAVAGSGRDGGGAHGFAGDGGSATSARLFSPWGVAVDGAGNLFIADAGNHRVRKVQGVAGAIPQSLEVAVRGTVTLQGRTASFPPGLAHSIARVTLYPCGLTVSLNADGSFEIPNVAPGMVTLTVSAPGYVSRQMASVAVAASPVTVPSVQLRCGLVNSDNVVNIHDITATVASLGTSPVARVDARQRFVDQNGDGVVNINDITCVVSGFGATSPESW